MDWNSILEYYYKHREPIIGGFLGLIIAIAFIIFGFLKVAFIILFVIIGCYIGKRISQDKYFLSETYKNIKNKIFPSDMR